MRNRFTRVCYALAAVVAVTTTLGLSAAGAASAASASKHTVRPNATTVCGSLCFDLSSAYLGPHKIQDAKFGAGAGHVIFLRQASNSFTYEDFEFAFTGIVGNTFTPGTACFIPRGHRNGLLPATSKLCLDGLYFGDPVWEASFAPDSNGTNWCVGVPSATEGAQVQLVPCGIGGGKDLWVGDVVNSGAPGYLPYINGGDSNFSNPLVLNVNISSHNPANKLNLSRENPSGGTVSDKKQFNVVLGPVF